MELEFAGGLFTLFGTGLDWLKWINSFVIRSYPSIGAHERRQLVPKGRGRAPRGGYSGTIQRDRRATSCVLVPTTDYNHRWGIAPLSVGPAFRRLYPWRWVDKRPGRDRLRASQRPRARVRH